MLRDCCICSSGRTLLQTAVKCMPVVQPGQCICKCFGSGLHHGVMEPALLPLHISEPGREGIYTPLKILHQMFGSFAMPTQPQLHKRFSLIVMEFFSSRSLSCSTASCRWVNCCCISRSIVLPPLDQFASAIANTIDLLVQRLQLLGRLQQKPLHLLSLLLGLHLGVFDRLQQPVNIGRISAWTIPCSVVL